LPERAAATASAPERERVEEAEGCRVVLANGLEAEDDAEKGENQLEVEGEAPPADCCPPSPPTAPSPVGGLTASPTLPTPAASFATALSSSLPSSHGSSSAPS
jgi:hypothetical protein